MKSTKLNNQKTALAQKGFSLVELMVALVVGLIVLAGVLQIFVGTRLTFNSNQALASIQENGRFALELIKPVLREGDVQGFCGADLIINSHLNTSCGDEIDLIYAPESAFLAWEYDGTGRNEGFTIPDDLDPSGEGVTDWSSIDNDGTALDLPAVFNGRVVPGSDVFIARRVSIVEGVTGATLASGSNPIDLTHNHGLDPNALVVVSNCGTGTDFFHATGAPDQLISAASSCGGVGPGNATTAWSTGFGTTIQVFEVQIFGYYVGFDADREETGLYRVDLSRGTGNAFHEELVSGVENMQVLAGYSLPADQGGDGQRVDFWLNGDEVPSWDFVIGARISLLMSSTENADTDIEARTFDLSGVAVTSPSDARLRQPFTATFSLRNQQLVF